MTDKQFLQHALGRLGLTGHIEVQEHGEQFFMLAITPEGRMWLSANSDFIESYGGQMMKEQ